MTIRKKLSDLKPKYASRDDNPNKMEEADFKALVDLVIDVGGLQPIFIDTKDEIIDGHHRFWAHEAAGKKDIECVVSHLSDEQNNALALALNKLRGNLDHTKVSEILKDIVIDTGWTLDKVAHYTGFSPDELESLLDRTKTVLEDLSDLGTSVTGQDDDEPNEAKPYLLEIMFSNKKDMQLAKKRLKKAAGDSKDLADGLMRLIGEDDGSQ